ncbi:hypothetical protein ACOZ4I_20175 (plasmid) [Haloarcula salina]|uniref:hypothetical protein n=1 Tax=Haloarcula salina TaxID=1429914 RepID=UPI003C7028DD
MGFDDLEDAAAEQDADDDDEAEPQSMPEATDTDSRAQSIESERTEPESRDRPAFSFDQSKQEAIYAREETIEAFEDALDFEVKRALRDEGVRDVPKRELHDALLRLGTEQPDRLADLVLEARE